MAVRGSRLVRRATAACAIAALAVPVFAYTAAAVTPAQAAVVAQRMVEVRPIAGADLGVQRVVGVTYEPASGALVVADGGNATRGVRVTPQADVLGPVDLPAGDPSTLTVDPGSGALTTVSSADAAHAGVGAPAGAAADASGTRVVLDGATGDLVRPDGTRTALAPVTGAPLRGLAVDPADGLLYAMNPGTQQLFGFDAGGVLRSVLDISSLGLVAPRAFAFAPSSDTTDDPSATHLFVADAGAEGSTGQVMESTVESQGVTAEATVTASLVQTIATSSFSPASPDPAGIEYVPGADRLEIVDSEVDEVTGAGYHDVNAWQLTRTGTVTDTGTTWTPAPGFSKEPNGLGYDAASKTFFISDDSADCIWVDHPGADTRLGTADDAFSCIDTKPFNSFDPEDPEFDPASGHLFFIDGVNTDVYELSPVDGIFGNGNDALVNQFDVGQYGPTDIEGLGSDAAHGTLLVGGRATKRIYEVTKAGALVTTIDATGIPGMRFISGLVQAPASDGSGRMDYYTVDRNLDNGPVPSENDGQLFELRVGSGAVNSAPVTKAGPDQTIPPTQTSVNVSGTVTDDALPNPPGITTSTWSQTSGPATVTFANASALATSASGFTALGDYVLRLTANDGALSTFDELIVHVGSATNVAPVVNAGADQTITAPQSSGNVTGTVTDDALPNPPAATTTTWSQTSGPATVTFGSPNAVSSTFSGLTAVGDYVLRLTASDSALSTFDELVVHVMPGTSTAGGLFPLTPARILDTRVGNGAPQAKVTGGSSIALQVTGRGGVPGSGAAAVVMNVTVTNPTVASHVTVWPTGAAKPTASNLNFVPGQTVPNLVTVGVGGGGKVSLYVDAGSVDLLADVVGYYGDASTNGAPYQPLSPSRILDSRNGTGGFSTPWASGQTRDLSLPGVPGGATAVALNVTETNPTATGFATVWPSGIPRPNPASNLNFVPGKTAPNLVVVPIGANGKVSLYNSAGSTDYIADLVGYYGPTGTTRFTPVVPVRLLDSRVGTGGFSTPWAAGQTRDLAVAGVATVPADAKAVVTNVTVTNPTATGHAIVWPSLVARPNVSNLNFVPGQTVPNLVMVRIGTNAKISLFNSAGSTDMIADVVGYFR